MNPIADDLLGRPLALVVALALVSLLPFLFMSVTAFVKISTVLHITKNAIGAQSVPSSVVVMALAGALTILAMAPVGRAISVRDRTPRLRRPHSTGRGARFWNRCCGPRRSPNLRSTTT